MSQEMLCRDDEITMLSLSFICATRYARQRDSALRRYYTALMLLRVRVDFFIGMIRCSYVY